MPGQPKPYLSSAASVSEPLIVGFGHFDPKIPATCGALWRAGWAPRILFTGGAGAGSADLDQPEARYFRNLLRRDYPEIPEDGVLLETTSTHTGENVLNSAALLRQTSPDHSFDRGLDRVVLVANAYRQRRVWLTCRRHLSPDIRLINVPPDTTFEAESTLFAEKGEDFVKLLIGEIDRILRYGELGYIEREPIPASVMRCYHHLAHFA